MKYLVHCCRNMKFYFRSCVQFRCYLNFTDKSNGRNLNLCHHSITSNNQICGCGISTEAEQTELFLELWGGKKKNEQKKKKSTQADRMSLKLFLFLFFFYNGIINKKLSPHIVKRKHRKKTLVLINKSFHESRKINLVWFYFLPHLVNLPCWRGFVIFSCRNNIPTMPMRVNGQNCSSTRLIWTIIFKMNAEQGNIQTCTFMTLHVYLGLLMSEMCNFQSHLKKKCRNNK